MRDGDYVPDGAGGFYSADVRQELLGRALFQLTARRGAFPLVPEVGSRLYQLTRVSPAARTGRAKEFAEEALRVLPNLSVTDALWDEGAKSLGLCLAYQGEELNLQLSLRGTGGERT
jgi:phage gp46-like protein